MAASSSSASTPASIAKGATVAMVGATGMLGRPVAQALLDAGFQLRVLARNPAKAADLAKRGAKVLPGDLRHPNTLQPLMQGAQALYLNLSVAPTEKRTDWHAEQQGLQNALDAAQAAGVLRVAYLASLIRHYEPLKRTWWVWQLKNEAVRRVEASPMASTVFNPSFFLESIPGQMTQNGALNVAGKQQYPFYPIAGADYGRQVANALLLPQAANRQYTIQGPEAMTTLQAAQRYAAVYPHARLKVRQAPLALLKVLGLVVPGLAYTSKVLTAVNHYQETFGAQDAWDQLGKPTITVEAFARAQAAPAAA